MLYSRVFFLVSCFILLNIVTLNVQGRYVHQPSIKRYIAQEKMVATWNEARQHCKSQGATLASPTDPKLFEYMASIIAVNNHTTPYYTGFTVRYNAELQFISEEGILLEDISGAAQDMIEHLDLREGGCLCMDRTSIRAVPCWSRLPYMCYKNSSVTATDPSTNNVISSNKLKQTEKPVIMSRIIVENLPMKDKANCDCESGYELGSGSCYKLYNEARVSWDMANWTCGAEGGYLAVINDNYEARLVKEITTGLTSVWIGLRSETGTSDWRSVRGDHISDIYNIWVNQMYSGSELSCGIMTLTGELEDKSCTNPYPFICENKSVFQCRDL